MIRSIGVIVPAHNEQELLPSCLASLRRAARAVRGVPVHLVVVADACHDQTAQVARRGGASVVRISAKSAGQARAAGARAILRRTRYLDPADLWLATTDADTLVPACWLRQQGRYASQGWDAIVGTIQVDDWSGRPAGTASEFRERYAAGTGQHTHVHGANLGCRGSAYLAAGGFPGLATGEDHAFVTALAATGSRVLRTRALPVTTSARRESRAPGGFADYLGQLDSASALGVLALALSGARLSVLRGRLGTDRAQRVVKQLRERVRVPGKQVGHDRDEVAVLERSDPGDPKLGGGFA